MTITRKKKKKRRITARETTEKGQFRTGGVNAFATSARGKRCAAFKKKKETKKDRKTRQKVREHEGPGCGRKKNYSFSSLLGQGGRKKEPTRIVSKENPYNPARREEERGGRTLRQYNKKGASGCHDHSNQNAIRSGTPYKQ